MKGRITNVQDALVKHNILVFSEGLLCFTKLTVADAATSQARDYRTKGVGKLRAEL